MSLFLFSPGARLDIDYAAETMTLVDGGAEDIIDLLITNHSPQPVDRVHLVYPHSIPHPESESRTDGRTFVNETPTLLVPSSAYNAFYSPDNAAHLEVEPMPVGFRVTLELPDPGHIESNLNYTGLIAGIGNLSPFDSIADGRISLPEWRVLTALGWSAYTLNFERPIEPQEARWCRLRGVTGTWRQNERPSLERWGLRIMGRSIDTFEVAGPLDVRHRFKTFLRAATVVRGQSRAEAYALSLVHALQEKLVTRGLDAPNTETVIRDWRLNVFGDAYSSVDEPTPWGDIRPCGPTLNTVSYGKERREAFQWKAGAYHIPESIARGHFTVRIRAHDSPLVILFVPWVALVVGLASLLVSLLSWSQ